MGILGFQKYSRFLSALRHWLWRMIVLVLQLCILGLLLPKKPNYQFANIQRSTEACLYVY